jgi:hypothetical protein
VLRILPPLPPLRNLLRTLPAAAPLAAGVAGVALAYAFLQRLYVGDWEDESPQELAALLLHLSPALAPDARHATVGDALADFAQSVQAPGLVGAAPAAARAQVAQARRDAAALLGGPTTVLIKDAAAVLPRRSHSAADMLLHCQATLERAAVAAAARQVLLRATRKLHFLAAWCADAEAAAEGALAVGARELLDGVDGDAAGGEAELRVSGPR